MADYIKKEDVSTDNIYEYEYADGAFSGYWLKFKYVSVPMDTQDPFNPVQDGDAEAVYDAYIFESGVRDVGNLIDSLAQEKTVDYFYVEESVYQDIAEDNPKILDSYSLIPYQITDKIMTVNKFYIPDIFNIENWKPIEFGTLNIVQDADQNISAVLQTDTDCTDKEVYVFLDGRANTVLNLKLKADSEDPTKLVLDDEYEDTTYDDTYLDENTTGTCELTVSTEENDLSYDINYSWTNEYVEPVIYVTPDRSYNMKICDKFSGILYGMEITGHVSGDNLPDTNTPLGIFYAKDFTNDITYCETTASTSGNQAIDLYLRSEWIGHFPLGDITDWTEDNKLEMYLVISTDETDFPGKVRIYPKLWINGQRQDNYINNISTEENPVKDYIEFDVTTTGTEELENWVTNFQNSVYLYQMEKPDTDYDYIINGLEWSISDLIIHYTDGTGISDLGELQQLSLTATDNKTFSDGTDTYSLELMEDLISVESQEDPQV